MSQNGKRRGPKLLCFSLMVFLLCSEISPLADIAGRATVVLARVEVESGPTATARTQAAENVASDPLNATYTIEGQTLPLNNGRSERASTPDSATRIKTAVFGNPVVGDLDADGDEDAALFVIHDPGGSGTFYYVAVALNENGQYRGTNAVLLGDRIIPGDLAIRNGIVEASFSDRPVDAPMSSRPSVEKQSYLTIDDTRAKA